jgi:hypothetical protein
MQDNDTVSDFIPEKFSPKPAGVEFQLAPSAGIALEINKYVLQYLKCWNFFLGMAGFRSKMELHS